MHYAAIVYMMMLLAREIIVALTYMEPSDITGIQGDHLRHAIISMEFDHL